MATVIARMSVGVNWVSMERIAKSAFHCQDVSMEDAMSPLNVFVVMDGMDCFVMSVSNSKLILEFNQESWNLNFK